MHQISSWYVWIYNLIYGFINITIARLSLSGTRGKEEKGRSRKSNDYVMPEPSHVECMTFDQSIVAVPK